jgi:amino acid adenylation domain-containing protein
MVLTGRPHPQPSNPVVHRVVEHNTRSHPDRLAVTCGADRLTYRELDVRANQLAHHLHGLGIGRGALVGICLDRSLELLVGILGVLKSGAAYVPLDPTYPADRLRLMTAQLPGMELVLAAESTVDLVRGVETLDPAAVAGGPSPAPAAAVGGDDLCYAVFTSGSTGTPKATAVRHRGWHNLLDWLRVEYGLDGRSSALMVSSFGFDITQRSLMAPLFTGATVHLLPSRSVDIGMAHRFVGQHRVRTLHLAPSTLYLLVERETRVGGDALKGLDRVFIGGEPMNAGRVVDWATAPGNGCLLLHQYGVAECTDVASSHPMRDWDVYAGAPLPAGRPVYNTAIHLLDDGQRPVPDGEVGEICVSGLSVGAGYLNPGPDVAGRFGTADLGAGPVRLYRTGDTGYATPAGELVVVGRLDHQVKIRGMRIDLGDVEHALRRHPEVRDVAVVSVADRDGDAALVAFVIPTGDGGTGALRRDLLDVLPRTMVPQRVVEVAAFPLNPNGKVDRQALAGSALR